MNKTNEIEVTDYPEFQKWAEGKSQSTKYHYKASLQKFCNFHGKNPRELINETRNQETENEETAHLEENIADQRLVEWYNHLMKDRNVSENSAQTYWRHIKAFYKKWGVEIQEPTPKAPTRTNHQPTYNAYDIRKIRNSARSNRDKAIISIAFQSGMDPQEICRLDYGQVKEAVENDKDHHFIWKTRKKSKVSHHAPILKDSIEALQLYITERGNREGKINDDDPLFVKKDSQERITSRNIRDIMRNIYERVGEEITKAKEIESQSKYNPFSLKYFRKAFGNACDEAGIPESIKKYWQGHNRDNHNGAYSGEISKARQKEALKKVKPYLTISTTEKEREEERKEQRKELLNLKKEVGKKSEEIQKLGEKLENQEEQIEKQRKRIEKHEMTIKLNLKTEIIRKALQMIEEDILTRKEYHEKMSEETEEYRNKVYKPATNKKFQKEMVQISEKENLTEKEKLASELTSQLKTNLNLSTLYKIRNKSAEILGKIKTFEKHY